MFRLKIILCASWKKYSPWGWARMEPYFVACACRTLTSNTMSHEILKHNFNYKSVTCNYEPSSVDVQINKYSTLKDLKCWNCLQPLKYKKFYCASCGALQYPKENMNYFELFGISQTFDMNLEELSMKFKEMQMTFHPDKYSNKTKVEMEISEMYSSLVNTAYATLKEPLKRGLYLLELKKLPKEDNFVVAPEFLTSILEKNEELDSINNEINLNKFMRTNSDEIKKHINLISESFYSNNWKEAQLNLLKLNYFINLDQKIKEKVTHFMSPQEK